MAASRSIVRERLRAAVKELERGRPAAARTILERVVELAPSSLEAWAYLGIAQLQLGHAHEAIAGLERACAGLPDAAWIAAHLADAYTRVGRHEAACAAFERACGLDPRNHAYRQGLATALALHGRYDRAAEVFEDLLRQAPGNALLWYNLGNARRDQGRLEEAARCFSTALDIAPDWVDARNSLGSTLHGLLRFEAAEKIYQACIEAQPDQIAFRLNLASVLIDAGRFDDAEAACRSAVTRWPDSALAHSFLGAALNHQGKLTQSLEHQRTAAALSPGDAQFAENHAFALSHVGRPDDAWFEFDRALALRPDAATTLHARALAMLGCGRLAEGWRDYVNRPTAREARRLGPSGKNVLPSSSDLRLSSVVQLVWEQGLGDELFFLRFARSVAASGRRVVYAASPKLRGFLDRNAEAVATFVGEESLDPDSAVMLLADLPLALVNSDFGANGSGPGTQDNANRAKHYPSPLCLTPSRSCLAQMTERLRLCAPPPYLAVTWRAGVPPKDQAHEWSLHKAIAVESLGAALRDAPGSVISVQRNPDAGELETLAAALGRPVHDFSALNDDLDAMLALLAIADEYVCVSNTNAHIRAGTGRPARVLIPGPAEWRWPIGQNESPWFPGFKLYHQGLDGDWTTALDLLRHDLLSRSST